MSRPSSRPASPVQPIISQDTLGLADPLLSSAALRVGSTSPRGSGLLITIVPTVPPGSTVVNEVKTDNGVVIKVISNGINYFLQAVNSIGNSLIFKIINLVETASLSSSFQSFARNVFSGMLNACGQILSSARSENNPKQIREIAIASYSLTGLWSLVSTAAYVGAYFALPVIGYTADTTKATRDFLFYTGFAIWPTLTLTTLGQVAYASGFWKSSLITSLLNRIPAIVGSYFLVTSLGLATTGIAAANLAAPWLVYLGMEFWMRRQTVFSDFFTSSLNDADKPEYTEIKKQFVAMAVLSLKVGFQRCTEWLNVLVITMLLGALNTGSLRAMNPSLNAISLWSLFSQGIGTGANMMVAKLIKSLEKAREWNQPEAEQAEIYANIKSVITKSIVAGVLINAAVGGGMYAARERIVTWFIDNPLPQTRKDAGVLLGVVGIGLVADAPRLIASTIMTAFGKPLSPNVVSLVLMSLGILGSYLMSRNHDDSFSLISMFAFRSATILLAALINLHMMYQSVVGLFADIDKKIEAKHVAAEEASTVVPLPASEEAQPNCFVRAYCNFFGAGYGNRPSVVAPALSAPLLEGLMR